MTYAATLRPACRVCGQQMLLRDRGHAQSHLPSEFVCWNVDCLEFGLYKRMDSLVGPVGQDN